MMPKYSVVDEVPPLGVLSIGVGVAVPAVS